jgi:HD-GYP domain-containing protein (c-di-GMP phosphodiesterase class II)
MALPISFDGKCYSHALPKDKISYPVVYRRAMKPLYALTIMTHDMKGVFDPKVLSNFISHLALPPPALKKAIDNKSITKNLYKTG